MTNTNHTDLDQFDRLCQTKTFYELNEEERQLVLSMVTEAEYQVMCELHGNIHEQIPDEIIPSSMLKNKLDKAWEAKNHRSGLFQVRISLFQSAAAAVIFFLVGLSFSSLYERPTKIIHTTAEVVKYVDRPVKQIQYVTLQTKNDQKQALQPQPAAQTVPIEELNVKNATITETNHQQTSAGTDIAQNDTNDMNMENDTVLRKMMVTMY